jgi:hypothetical protein
MGMIIKHIKRWNVWRKHNTNGFAHKILVLFGIIKSPTFYCTMTNEEAKAFYDCFMEELKALPEAYNPESEDKE